MLIGEYVTKLSGLTQCSPIFPRGGQGANFAVDVLDVPGGGASLLIVVETKDSSDTVWNTLASFSAITSTGVKNIDATAIMEQLRFTFTISGGSASSTFYVNVLSPQWRP
jgi:hypothetical protein